MTTNTIFKIAEELGLEAEYKRYNYWDNILHIGNTAMCFSNATDMNNFGIITEPENFPKFVTKEYIKEQILAKEDNLGHHKSWVWNSKPFGTKEWFSPEEHRYNCDVSVWR